ncbi:hypothetical protein HG530_008871 [Fusarium avenaceum]|nr:hypothetical protein HG530_008871 [Fusarium avenaceum]
MRPPIGQHAQLRLVLYPGTWLESLNSVRLQQLLSLGPLHLDSRCRLSTALVLVTSHLLQMHLVRSIGQPQRPDARPHVSQRRVLRDTCAAVCLDCAVDDGEGGLGDENLRLCDLLEGLLGTLFVHLDGSVENDETCGVDLDTGLGDPFKDDTVFAEKFAKWLLGLVVDAEEHPVKSTLGLQHS